MQQMNGMACILLKTPVDSLIMRSDSLECLQNVVAESMMKHWELIRIQNSEKGGEQ